MPDAPSHDDSWIDEGDFLSSIIETQNDIAAVELDERIILQLVAERAQSLTGADGASVQFLIGDVFVCRAVSGIMTPHLGLHLPSDSTLSGLGIRTGPFQYCQDTETDPRVDRSVSHAVGARSLVIVPMYYGAEPIGVLNVVSTRPRAFQKREISALRLMAGVVTAALVHASELEVKKNLLTERTAALTALRASEEQFRTLAWLERDRREVLELVAQNHPLCDVVDRLLNLVERQMGDGQAAMILIDEGGMTLHAATLSRALCAALQNRLLTISSALAKGTSDARVEIVITELTADGIPPEVRKAAEPDQVRACWTAPIHSNDGVPLGLLTVFSKRQSGPTESESSVLIMAGKLTTISIEHHTTAQQLSHLVRHDPLTRLPNRIMCEERMQQALALGRRSGRSAAVMVLDIDKFKSVNDTLGHGAGDHLLQQFAQRLRRILRETDTLARIGGDEFVVVLPELANGNDAAIVAQKLIESLWEPIDLGYQKVNVTASIGIAVFPQDGNETVILQKKADDALYRAKERGRNGYSF